MVLFIFELAFHLGILIQKIDSDTSLSLGYLLISSLDIWSHYSNGNDLLVGSQQISRPQKIGEQTLCQGFHGVTVVQY
jgi:hypothetical protein